MSNRTINDTPARLVENGKPVLGAFADPFATTDLYAAQGPFGRLARRLRTKEWVGFGIVHPDFYLSTMISNTKYLASGVVYIADRKTGALYEYEEPSLPFLVPVAATSFEGDCRFRGLTLKLDFEMRIKEEGRIRLRFDCKGRGKNPSVRGELSLAADRSLCAPLVVSLPVRPSHHTYTHKMLMPTSGSLQIGEQRVDYLPARDLANLDEQKGYYPFNTTWRWASFAGYTQQGRILGLNIADHQFADPDTYNENAIWYDGRLSLLGTASLDFNQDRPLDPWSIRDHEGRVDVTFHPEGRKVVRHNFGLIKIDYFQAYGRFRGTLRDEFNQPLPNADFYGVAERMFMRS